jgi:lipopolysaccharide export system protein LptA
VEPPEPPADAEQKKQPRGVTEITSREAMLDNRKHLATFNGDVVVKDPQYNLTCDKLTVYLKATKTTKNEKDAKPAQPAPIGADPEPVAKPGEKEKEDSGGIERAVAEGNVEIVQEKVNPNGKRQRYFGKARRAVFDNDKKTCVLYGWPRIAQSSGDDMGKETFALQENTVITLDQAGTINVDGLSKTRLTDLSGFELKEKDNGSR